MNSPLTRPELERLLIDESPDAAIVTSPNGEVWLWNRGATETFGHDEPQALGRTLAQLIVPDECLQQDEDIRRAALDGPVLTRSALRRRRDGRLLHVDTTTRAVRDAAGGVSCLITVIKDVTSSEVQRYARWIEQHYRELLDSVPDALVIVDDSGCIVMFNGQAERMFGYGRSEVIGSSIETLMPPRFRGGHVMHRGDYVRRPRTRDMASGLELWALRSNGEEFPVEIALSPLVTDQGRLVVSAIRDVSDRRRVEKLLREDNAALLAAGEHKDRFLATVSHELRTPLNAILGFTDLLCHDPTLHDAQRRQVDLVRASAGHLMSLIGDLLDLARVQAGVMKLHPEAVDAAAVLAEVHATLEPLARVKALAFTLDAPAPVMLQTDRRALRQILINLVNNAIKFTERGAVRLRVSVTDAHACLAVEDTGPGIAAADRPRLFQAFSQVGDPSRHHEGSGLGLHLSSQLAACLGGHIDVHGAPGEGSRFALVLPVPAAPPAPSPAEATARSA